MARLNVSPTRMVLQDLTARLKTSTRGHKLLKDKQDELMRRFIESVRHNLELRREVEAALAESFKDFMLAAAVMSPERLEEAVSFSKFQMLAEVTEVNMMSVPVPQIRYERRPHPDFPEAESQQVESYGYAQTSADLDEAIERLNDIMDKLLELAEVEKTCQLLAEDIESTRRRVNALEYRTIPDLEETIKYIRMKLDEDERATLTRLMKVKDLIDEEGAI